LLKRARIMRITCLVLAFLPLLSLPSPAHARLPGHSVRVAIEGRREAGIGLRGDGRGWRLPLGGAAVTSVVLVDLTSPTRDKWVLPVDGKSLVLDGARFVGGHAYRVELMKGMTLVDRALVYLYPTRGGRTTKVEFDVDSVDSSDELQLTPKSAL
jgi:hypothetical protein